MKTDAMYKELIVWQQSMDLVDIIYKLIKTFPKTENYRLCDQLSRAAVSIPSNIAEGNGRGTRQDYARFLSIARGSLYETMTQVEIARRQGYIDDISEIESLADSIRRMLNSMIHKLSS
ncbi:MAG: four helix bundle protein [Kiritimatiellae bacterium]|nr:four helix bundle protein [Kiritimatiellia bacterium]